MNSIGNFSYVSSKSLNNDDSKRHDLFKPSGALSAILSQRPIVVKIGRLLFCHAGLTTQHLNILKKYNKDISYINSIWKNFIKNSAVLLEDGILWTRDLNNTEEVAKMLESIGCNYMFVGHTVVDGIKILNERIWYTDTGISRAFGNTSFQYIDIYDNQVNIRELKTDVV